MKTANIRVLIPALLLGGLAGPAAAGKLNDTGINSCADAFRNGLPCPVAGFPRQDAQLGRDARARAGTLKKIGGGRSGFDFTRLSGGACVRDNTTGLVWESKTKDGGLRDADNTYTWYNPNSQTNGGDPGYPNGGHCVGSACDTWAYAEAVNALKLCGYSDWRLPTAEELRSLLDYSVAYPGPTIDTAYFPNTRATGFWSASPYASYSYYAWLVIFDFGQGIFGGKNYNGAVRLVRGGQ